MFEIMFGILPEFLELFIQSKNAESQFSTSKMRRKCPPLMRGTRESNTTTKLIPDLLRGMHQLSGGHREKKVSKILRRDSERGARVATRDASRSAICPL